MTTQPQDLQDLPSVLSCTICHQLLHDPQFLPCLHVFCLVCLRENASGQSRDRFICPLCPADPDNRRSQHARPWHSFEKILKQQTTDSFTETDEQEYDSNGTEINNDDNSDEDEDNVDDAECNTNASISASLQCSVHADKIADKFCTKCNQLACHKCITSFHRRCPETVDIDAAVESKRSEFESAHDKISTSLMHSDHAHEELCSRAEDLEKMRTQLLVDIKSYRTQLINLILEKEKTLVNEVNQTIDGMKNEVVQRQDLAEQFVKSLHQQLDVLNFSFSVKGQGELLPFLPSLKCRVEAVTNRVQQRGDLDDAKQVCFVKEQKCLDILNSSPLGHIGFGDETGLSADGNNRQNGSETDGRVHLTLNLLTSFHGGSRDDIAKPLLTDLVVLASGDVIVVDRDNKSVKKFNQSGKLLTRVPMEATPSRIAIVSHGRAAVSVMNKKAIYFLSLLGTVQVLHSVKVKKCYSFLTCVGGGALVAGTNHCDSIDLLSESGELIRTIYTQKPDRASIARPLYLTPATPISFLNGRRSSSHQERQNHRHSSSSTSATASDDILIPDVLISDSGKRTLFRLTQTGSVPYTVRSNETLTLECPLGVTVHECGVTLLADRDSDSILLLDRSGHVIKPILTSQEGLVKPCGVYAGQRGRVALTQVDGMVKIYRAIVKSESAII